MYDSPFAPGTGLKWPCPDYTFKSKLSPDEYLNYVSPVSGVPMYMTQKEWEHQISLYVTTYLTAENLHIPQWLARPAGRYLKPPNTGKIMDILFWVFFQEKLAFILTLNFFRRNYPSLVCILYRKERLAHMYIYNNAAYGSLTLKYSIVNSSRA